MVWHPKAEPQESTSAPPDLHQTVTTITGLQKKKKKKKIRTIFVHTECVRVHVTTLWTLQ